MRRKWKDEIKTKKNGFIYLSLIEEKKKRIKERLILINKFNKIVIPSRNLAEKFSSSSSASNFL